MPSIHFSWTHDTEDRQIFYRLYENDALVVDDIGQLEFSLLMSEKPFGLYRYHVTAVDRTTRLESAPSNHVEVVFQVPKPPVEFAGTWINF